MSKYEEKKKRLLSAPDVSDWFKKAIEGLDSRDVVDAICDVEELYELMIIRWNERNEMMIILESKHTGM